MKTIVFAGSAWLLTSVAAPAEPTFKKDIAPIFKRRCTKCHGLFIKQKGLSLRSLKALRKGGESGPVIVPGSPEKSLLVKQLDLPVTDLKRMPPVSEGAGLTGEEKSLIEEWVRAGAK